MNCENLKNLTLENCRITSFPLKHLGVSALTRLDLSENPLSIDGIRLLAASISLARLRLLKLSKCGLKSEGLMTLVNSSVMTKLEVLLVPFNLITHIKVFSHE